MGITDISDSASDPIKHPRGFKQGAAGIVINLYGTISSVFQDVTKFFQNFGLARWRRKKIRHFQINSRCKNRVKGEKG